MILIITLYHAYNEDQKPSMPFSRLENSSSTALSLKRWANALSVFFYFPGSFVLKITKNTTVYKLLFRKFTPSMTSAVRVIEKTIPMTRNFCSFLSL